MSFWIWNLVCNSCGEKWSTQGGVIGRTIIEGRYDCPKCESKDVTNLGRPPLPALGSLGPQGFDEKDPQ